MSNRKKEAQEYRKEARRQLGGYRDELVKRLDVFNEALKPRPRYIPRRVWNWLLGRIINVEKMQKLINPIE